MEKILVVDDYRLESPPGLTAPCHEAGRLPITEIDLLTITAATRSISPCAEKWTRATPASPPACSERTPHMLPGDLGLESWPCAIRSSATTTWGGTGRASAKQLLQGVNRTASAEAAGDRIDPAPPLATAATAGVWAMFLRPGRGAIAGVTRSRGVGIHGWPAAKPLEDTRGSPSTHQIQIWVSSTIIVSPPNQPPPLAPSVRRTDRPFPGEGTPSQCSPVGSSAVR
jgi:hypothetical protein